MQVCGLYYLVLNYIFQNCSHSGQRLALLFHLTHMSQMSNVFIILWQTKLHEYDLWQYHRIKGKSTKIRYRKWIWHYRKTACWKVLGSNIDTMTTLIFLFQSHITILVWHQHAHTLSFFFFFHKANRGASWCQRQGSTPGRQFEGWLKEPLGLTCPIVHTTRLKKI